MITIVHGGQTGVDRGAHFGALAQGLSIAGFMPHDARDELGPIPKDVAKHLGREGTVGYGTRTLANLSIADAVLCIVENRREPYATPGTCFTLQNARRRDIERMTVDPSTPRSYVLAWLNALRCAAFGASFRLMIAGPRASRWASAEAVARDVVTKLAIDFAGCEPHLHDVVTPSERVES